MDATKTFWYISKYFAPKTSTSPGGRGWFLVKESADMGYVPVVITSDSNNLADIPELKKHITIEKIESVQMVWLKTLKYGVAKSYLRILSWFHFEWNLLRMDVRQLPQPDTIVVSSLSLLTILNGIRLKRKFGCRLVFEVRDIWPLTITEEGGVSRRNPFVWFLSYVERLGYKNSDAIIGTMPNLEQHIREVSRSQVPVHCIPMGVAPEQVDTSQPLEEEFIERYLSSSSLKVVHAGTIGITNALEVFFEAAELLKHNPAIQFILVGDGALKQYYIEKYKHLPNLVFAPKVNKLQVQTVLGYCDIVYFSVFNSKVWQYGQSLNKVIDYMLSGKPIVASYSGYPSMINEAQCGTFVPAGEPQALADELMRLSKLSAEERNAIGQNGRTWLLKNRSYTQLTKEFVNILFS